MPIVDIKGVGKAQFPDDMSKDNIRNFLRNKYSQQLMNGESDILAPKANIAAPYEPTLAEKMGQGVSNALSDTGIISNRHGAQGVGKNLTTLAEFLPGVGDATAGDDFGRALKGGNYGDAALAGVGAVPLLGDMAIFAGKMAKNADLGALSKAQLWEDAGKNRDEIWKETGWVNDKGDWKFEISDALDFDTGKGADINPSSFDMIKDYGGTTQQNFMEHPDLYEAYPNLTDRPVKSVSGSGGMYNSKTDTLSIGEGLLNPTSAGALDDAQSVGLHEAQHAIQNREGFQSGGSPKQFEIDSSLDKDIKVFGKVLEDRLSLLRGDKYYKDLSSSLKVAAENKDVDQLMDITKKQAEYLNGDDIVKRYKKDLHELYGYRGDTSLTPMDKYQRLTGEAEARNVQTRMNWTPEQRRDTPPWKSLDVPEDELIYRKAGSGNQLSTADALPMGESSNQTLGQLSDGISNTKGVKSLSLLEDRGGDMVLNKIIIDKESRGGGVGAKAMSKITKYADKNGKIIKLDVGQKGDFRGEVTSPAKLKAFYKKLGFVENKGKNKDYEISQDMYRIPAQ